MIDDNEVLFCTPQKLFYLIRIIPCFAAKSPCSLRLCGEYNNQFTAEPQRCRRFRREISGK